VLREAPGWRVMRGRAENIAATLRADPDSAWRLLYNALPADRALQKLTIAGDRSLIKPMLEARAVMV
jgi:hypothetical protein